MFTKNSTKDGFINGTTGVIIGFSTYPQYPIVKINNGKSITVEPTEWTIEDDGKVKAMIKQLPIRLAWAITVHKSQGMSLDSAIIDLTKTFEYGQGYVALSRVSSLNGLQLSICN